jgi:general secretion pathway protein G
VTKKYLRRIPVDPITESATTWVLVDPPDKPGSRAVFDVRSGAPGKSLGGTPYGEL